MLKLYTAGEDICNVQQSLQSARENARYGNVFNACEIFLLSEKCRRSPMNSIGEDQIDRRNRGLLSLTLVLDPLVEVGTKNVDLSKYLKIPRQSNCR